VSWIDDLRRALDEKERDHGPVRKIFISKRDFLVTLPTNNWDPSGPLDFVKFDDGRRVEIVVDESLREKQVVFEF
jgi:hypothetical protein